jgi:hypothetical protein
MLFPSFPKPIAAGLTGYGPRELVRPAETMRKAPLKELDGWANSEKRPSRLETDE